MLHAYIYIKHISTYFGFTIDSFPFPAKLWWIHFLPLAYCLTKPGLWSFSNFSRPQVCQRCFCGPGVVASTFLGLQKFKHWNLWDFSLNTPQDLSERCWYFSKENQLEIHDSWHCSTIWTTCFESSKQLLLPWTFNFKVIYCWSRGKNRSLRRQRGCLTKTTEKEE